LGIVKDIREGLAGILKPSAEQSTEKAKAYKTSSALPAGAGWSLSYNGEKNSGELGPPINYLPNYAALRVRSWQSYTESEVTKTVIDRYVTWAVGTGLKLQASPNLKVLQTENIEDFTKEGRNKFAAAVEARFKIWSENTFSTYSGNSSFSLDEGEAMKNTLIGGDVLVVMRLVKGVVKVQLIDGQHIQTPLGLGVARNGNRIVNGVELDSKGAHTAYYVKRAALDYKRIQSVGRKSKQKLAFMVYGSRYRIDSTRGMPLVSIVLETLKKLERYKEATVGSAEERAKIVYQIVHSEYSTGESPLLKRLATANDVDGSSPDGLPVDVSGNAMARTVAVSTDKQTFNMAQGSELKALESKVEINFKDFYDTNFDIICAALGIPPNVARMLYDDNFSASRAALKDWENSLRVIRKKFSAQLNEPVYKFWLWSEILSKKVQAKGYTNALAVGNEMAVAAYSSSRWIGSNVPHIDPLKEARAEREKLGPLGVNVPLTTPEKATENLGEGESTENFIRFSEELAAMDAVGLETEDEKSEGV